MFGVALFGFWLFFTFFSWRNLDVGVYFLIVMLPSYLIRFSLGSIPLTYFELLLLTLFFVWVFRVYLDNRKIFVRTNSFFNFSWRYFIGLVTLKKTLSFGKISHIYEDFHKIRPWLLLWIFAGVLSVLVAPDLRMALGLFKAYIFEPVLFFIMFIGIIKTRKQMSHVVFSLGALSFFVSIYAIGQYFCDFGLLREVGLDGSIIKRTKSFFEYPNAVGLLIAPIIGLYLQVFLDSIFSSENRRRFFEVGFSGIVILTGIVAIVFSRTEAALVALAVVFTGLLIWYNRYTRLVFFLSVTAVGSWLYYHQAVWQWISDKILLRDFSGIIRQMMYSETWILIKDHAFFGTGIGGYQESMLAYHQPHIWIGKVLQPVEIFLYPHTLVFNFWTHMGLLGLLISIGVVLYILCKSFFRIKNLRVYGYVIVGLSVMIIHGLVDVPFFKNDLAILSWIFIGLFIICGRLSGEFVGPRIDRQG